MSGFRYPIISQTKRRIWDIVLLSYFLQVSGMDNRLEAHKNHLPFSAPWGFSCESILYFKTSTLPTALWLAGSTLWSVRPWFCACNRTKYACRDDGKLPHRLPQCRDGRFADTHADNGWYLCTLWVVCLKPIHNLFFHASYNYKQRGKHFLLLSHNNLHAGLPQHLVLCKVSR